MLECKSFSQSPEISSARFLSNNKRTRSTLRDSLFQRMRCREFGFGENMKSVVITILFLVLCTFVTLCNGIAEASRATLPNRMNDVRETSFSSHADDPNSIEAHQATNATFANTQYTITASAGTNGSISPNGAVLEIGRAHV